MSFQERDQAPVVSEDDRQAAEAWLEKQNPKITLPSQVEPLALFHAAARERGKADERASVVRYFRSPERGDDMRPDQWALMIEHADHEEQP